MFANNALLGGGGRVTVWIRWHVSMRYVQYISQVTQPVAAHKLSRRVKASLHVAMGIGNLQSVSPLIIPSFISLCQGTREGLETRLAQH